MYPLLHKNALDCDISKVRATEGRSIVNKLQNSVILLVFQI